MHLQKNMPRSCLWMEDAFLLDPLPGGWEMQEGNQRAQEEPGHTQWVLFLQGQAAKSRKGEYRQLRSQPVTSVNSSILAPKYPNSSSIWIPSALGELRGAGWTKHFNRKSSLLVQTPFSSPGCGSSFHLLPLCGPGWTRKKLLPFLFTSRESLPAASCF